MNRFARMTELRFKLKELRALSPEWYRLNGELCRLMKGAR